MHSKLLKEAVKLLERKRDGLLFESEKRVKDSEINQFIERVKQCLKD